MTSDKDLLAQALLEIERKGDYYERTNEDGTGLENGFFVPMNREKRIIDILKPYFEEYGELKSHARLDEFCKEMKRRVSYLNIADGYGFTNVCKIMEEIKKELSK